VEVAGENGGRHLVLNLADLDRNHDGQPAGAGRSAVVKQVRVDGVTRSPLVIDLAATASPVPSPCPASTSLPTGDLDRSPPSMGSPLGDPPALPIAL
jgi:hypothetical protein